MKKDIFISHSSKDREMIEEICTFFENEGFTCWVSYRIEDLHAGQDYMAIIPRAISDSRVFISCCSDAAFESEQVENEIHIANKYKSSELQKFCVILDDNIRKDELPNIYEYGHAKGQRVYWSDKAERNDLLEQIKKCILQKKCTETAVIQGNCKAPLKLIGRESDLVKLHQYVEQYQKIYLYGIGGIGKTALALYYGYQRQQQNDELVIYLPIENSVIRAIANDDLLVMENTQLKDKKRELSTKMYAEYKLSLLENSILPNTLIILDNVNDLRDPIIDRILALPCRIIITTRYKNLIDEWMALHIRAISHMDDAVNLFSLHYGKTISEQDTAIVKELLESVAKHTMTIILLAKQMKSTERSLSEYIDIRQLKQQNLHYIQMITSGNERKSEIADMYRNLQELFDARNLTEEERTVIKVLILFPLSGTKRNLFLKLVGFEYTVALSELEQTGWVEFNETNEVIFLHPVIKDIIDERFNITIEDKDIKRYTSNFMLNIRDCYNHNYQENNQYRELALSYIHYFPNPMISNYKNYLLISKLLWVLNMFDESIEIQNKIQTLFIDKEGKHANSAEEAEAMLQLGFINHGNGKYSEAAENLKLAARVFGNKYAAALSHQAQAMAFDNAGIEEIEPLLEQSLSIREKYWPNTISEAASCHLYAKMLSKYDSNLEKAISLEKRALSIFKRIDQEADANHKQGANISSAKYILGWLYVQQASDNDDLEDGIELLEEAKEQRLKDRGDVLHFWMEDIYLKLAQAYEKAEKYSEAEDYYNLLIKLQNKKYKENLSDKNILSTYRMLMELYDKMGKNAEAKKCRRLIRKYELV